jgi:glycosyltransferase involved in cell wall biosynthesis
MDWVLVQSVWWENDPLVIQEAFLARRPVLCSDIGGMAEAVPHGIAGYHVPVGDPAAWADAMAAVLRRDGPPPVWTFPPPRDMDACVRAYRREYRP